MNANNHLELFLTLNAEAFKKGLSSAGTGVRTMAGGASTAFKETQARIKENLIAVKDYNKELGQQSNILQTLKGHVSALVGAYLGFQSIAGIVGMMKAADSAAFTLEASLRAANREFSNIGDANSWAEVIDRLSAKLRIYSKSELKTAAAATVDMTKRLELSKEQMEQVIVRTADLSAGKTDLQGGIERVTAALRGEAEASEYLGLTLNETYVTAWHNAHNAAGVAWKDLSDLEKAQVRYNVFLEQAGPLAGKAADSVRTFAGAYALARKEISDAVEGSGDATEAMKKLASVIADNADEIGELATMIITAAAKTMEFVLAHKEVVVTIGLLVAGAGTLSFTISSLTTIWQALNSVMLLTTGSKLIPWLGSLIATLKGTEVAALGLKGVVGGLAGVFGAAMAGWSFGTWLNQFGPVQKGMTSIIYSLDRLQLAARKMWATLTGGDTAEIERQIEIAKRAYNERLAEIDQEVADREKEKSKPAGIPASPEPPPVEKPQAEIDKLTTDTEAKAKETWPDEWLSPEELKKRQEERAKIIKSDPAVEAAPEAEQRAVEQAVDTNGTDSRAVAEAEAAARKAAKEQAAAEELAARRERMRAGLADEQAAADEELQQTQQALDAQSEAEEQAAQEAEQKKAERRERNLEASRQAAEEERQAEEERDGRTLAYEEQMQQAQQETLEAAKQGADERAEAEVEAADKAKSAFQRYFDKVKELSANIVGRERSVAEELDSLDSRGSEESRWRKKAKDAKEYETAAKAAMAAGDNEKALSLSDKARELYSSLKGGAGTISEETAQRSAYSGVKSSGELGLTISKMLQQVSVKGALASLPSGNDLFGNLSANIRGQLAAVTESGQAAAATPERGGMAPAAKVHELRFAGGSLRGGEEDVNNLLRLLEKAGMSAA